MGTYVVIGGLNGMGKATVETLRAAGNEVIVIDREPGGDILSDMAFPDQRVAAVEQVFARCPDGIDGLAIVAGMSMSPDRATIVSVNYYGTIFFAEALFPLLQKKHGSCVLNASASLTWSRPEKTPHFSEMLANCGDEERMCRFANFLPADSDQNMYYTTKYALSLWMRRHSIEWGLQGVRLNAVAPGCVNTRLGQLSPEDRKKIEDAGHRINDSFHMTIPMYCNANEIMPPQDLAEAFVFLLSHRSSGINGNYFIVDAGQDAYYNTEKVYF